MIHKVWLKIQKFVASLAVSVGVLAIANVEMFWQNYRAAEYLESNKVLHAGRVNRKRVDLALQSTSENYKPLQSALSQSLEQDEIKDENPFAHLSSMDPLRLVMKKGVAKFHRETFRSPGYQEESGYDLLSYEIEHTDGSQSTILAYLEKSESSLWRNVGAPDLRTVHVVFYIGGVGKSLYSFYKSGDLVEQAELTNAEAQTQVAQRLSQGVPFLSVSR